MFSGGDSCCIMGAEEDQKNDGRNRKDAGRCHDRLLFETNFDESQLSALETKFAHYLSAAEASSQNIAQEKDKIKTLIADISHQTKTPIANLLLYSELLMEETLPASAKANVEALYKQSEKLRFLIDSLVKLSRLENGIISFHTYRFFHGGTHLWKFYRQKT